MSGSSTPQTVTLSGTVNLGGTEYKLSMPVEITPVTAPPVTPPATSKCLLGIYDPADDYPSSWSGIQAFQSAGCPVKVATYYVQWGGGFPANLASLAWANGQVIPFVEMEPWYSTAEGDYPAFTDIAAGKYDTYLQSMAQSVVAYGHPCYFTYAHEQNGSWYPWGNGAPQKVTPAQWIASWQHVVTVMNAVPGAASLITWVWAPNNADVGSVVPYWPGQQYVGLAAFDGYLKNAGQTYANFLEQTVTQIRTLTSGPVWLAETGITPADSTRAARITGFAADLKAAGVSGFNWFNQTPFNLTAAETTTFASAVSAWNAA